MLRLITFLLLLYLIISCGPTKPTYSREDIQRHIIELCKKEFNIEVRVWHEVDTIWVYAPFEDILEKGGQKYREEISKNVRRIFMALARIILSMENRPKFYCFVVSDIKNGIDVYYIWAIIDYIKFLHNYISQGEFNKRQVFIAYPNILAINDKEGSHIKPYNIKIGEFISYLVKQSIIEKFNSDKLKDVFKVDDIETNFINNKLTIKLDIKQLKYKPHLEDTFEEAKEITKKFLKIYEPQDDILEVEIKDNIKSKIYSKMELLKNNF